MLRVWHFGILDFRLRKSKGIQWDLFGWGIDTAPEHAKQTLHWRATQAFRRFGNLRYSRLGNLRYVAGIISTQS